MDEAAVLYHSVYNSTHTAVWASSHSGVGVSVLLDQGSLCDKLSDIFETQGYATEPEGIIPPLGALLSLRCWRVVVALAVWTFFLMSAKATTNGHGEGPGQDTHVRILSDRGQPRVATNVKGPLQPYFSTTSKVTNSGDKSKDFSGTTLPQRVHRTNPPLHSAPLFTRLSYPLLCPTNQDQVRGGERGVLEFNQKTAHDTPCTRHVHPETPPPHPLSCTFLNHQGSTKLCKSARSGEKPEARIKNL